MIRLWLDDLRPMPNDFTLHVKTAHEAIEILKTNDVEYISFDHDLGEEKNGTGYDVAKWIEENVYNKVIKMMEWNIHSANPVGRKNIESAMKSAERLVNRNDC